MLLVYARRINPYYVCVRQFCGTFTRGSEARRREQSFIRVCRGPACQEAPTRWRVDVQVER